MAYANFYAKGRKIESYFKGGIDTDCFNAFERNGFIIKKKMKNENLYKLKEEFLDYWSVEKLQNMTLEEYTDTKRENSFCYWLEHITRDLGSIVGGSSYKFGIYKMGATSKTEAATNRDNDGVYAWHTKYGATAVEAFNTIKNLIINVANYANKDNLNPIEDIDLGDAYKWKIAFMYSNYKVINIFKSDALKPIANSLYPSNNIPTKYGDLNLYILSNNTEESYFDFTKKLWKHFDSYNSKEKEFKKWLEGYTLKGSNKLSSYLRAIKIINNDFKIPIYTENDISVLEDLYDDLINHQRDPKGKYAYSKKSYGEKGFYSAAIKTYIEFLTDNSESKVFENDSTYTTEMIEKASNAPLNQILFGPPGTGKTYQTINKAIEIINPEFDTTQERNFVKQEYDRLVKNGLIVFTTFHQSTNYEDFIEGIKPETTENDTIIYKIEDGLFKNLCIEAKGIPKVDVSENIDFTKCNFYKMSLGGKNRKGIHDWCLDNDYIALGWGGNNDLNKINNNNFKEHFYNLNPELETESKYHQTSSIIFKNYMKIGDVVMATLGNHILDAIGIIESDYEYKEINKIHYKHYRKVKWLVKNMNSSPKLFLDKNISQQSIYQFNTEDVNISKLDEMFNKKESAKDPLKKVLIIDEINRGNVSAIFGELITLLEESKRLGNDEALEVVLPYSKEKFGVPNNVYIIGTMNTADRSVEALDTALRRRFDFKEMMPDYTVIENEEVKEVNLSEVLKTINQRIELLIDRDHTIGHSYFVGVDTPEKLANAFNNKIVPLLQEYFYGDYGKIGLVLGKGFVKKQKNDTVNFANFGYENANDFKTPSFLFQKIDKYTVIEAVLLLLGNKKSNKTE